MVPTLSGQFVSHYFPGGAVIPGRRSLSSVAALVAFGLISACGGSSSGTSGTETVGAPTISMFSALPPSVEAGTQVTLTWTVANATDLTITPNVGAVTGSSRVVNPTQTTTYTLTASNSAGSVFATATVTVNPAPVASLTVTLGSPTLKVGSARQATVVLKDAYDNTLLGRTVTWATGSSEIATVDANGLVTAVAIGTTSVTATCEGKSGGVTVEVSDVPGAPTSVVAAAGNQAASVAWAAPATDGGTPLTGYTILVSPAAPAAVFSISGTTGTVFGLANGTSYSFRVVAANALGDGPPSMPSNTVTPVSGPAGAPTAVLATAGVRSASLSWTAPASNGGSAISGYSIQITPSVPSATISVSGATAVITGLANSTTYTFTVAAITPAGTGVASLPSNPVTTPGLPGALTGVVALAGDASASLVWAAPVSTGGSPITGYSIVIVPTAAAANVLVSGTSATVGGLTNGVTYTFRVSARSAVGEGPLSGPSNAVTPLGLPGAPVGLKGTGGNASVQLAWSPPTSDGGSAITGYTLSLTPSSQSASIAISGTGATVSGLVNGASYVVQVRAVSAAGTGPGSAIGPITPLMPVASIIVAVTSQWLDVGGHVDASAWPYGSDGSQLSTRQITLRSANPATASVDATGRVTGLAPGKAEIVAFCEGVIGSVWVVVSPFGFAGNLTVPRSEHAAALLSDGRVLLAGGYDAAGRPLASAEIYDPATGSFSITGSMSAARGRPLASALPDGKVLVAAGEGESSPVASAEVYDPATGTFEPPISMLSGHRGGSATPLLDGRVFITGDGSEIYDPSIPRFVYAGNGSFSRSWAATSRLLDGKVLVAGGWGSAGTLGVSQVFDPVAGTWDSTGDLNIGRFGAAATTLLDGRVLITGGQSGGSLLADVEVYNPDSRGFLQLAGVTVGMRYHTGTLLDDGTVLYVGGYNGGTSWLFDPATMRGSPLGWVGRAKHTATRLLDGHVLIAGGDGAPGSAELFSGWTEGTLSAPRGNVAPVADAGVQQVVAAGTTVSLDAGRSGDLNGDPLQFAWTLSSVPAGSTAVLSSPGTRNPTFVADVPGDYVISLVVTDGIVASDPASIRIIASPSMSIEAESNDSSATATQFSVGQAIASSLGTVSDVDWMRVWLTGGGTVTARFDASGMASGGWSVYWYDPDLVVLSGRNIGASLGANSLSYQLPTTKTGYYYVRVQPSGTSMYNQGATIISLTTP